MQLELIGKERLPLTLAEIEDQVVIRKVGKKGRVQEANVSSRATNKTLSDPAHTTNRPSRTPRAVTVANDP